ncbi:hypothetical protein RclHR1_00970031 [Rhizophagus clarus]|uniref:Uncharacterized protein n=1 Tax=Rhizophagus clarus TaxID=94130 RepID=A0A2Z6SI63_9GLOM|nr:hypothetical protein RclHR1_00970031 [Rhizophagus clarus]
MPNNVARRGCGSFNSNSRKASHQEQKKDNNNSDNSGFDSENTVQQKRSETVSEQAMDEDIIADTAADAGVEVLASSPKENNTASTSLSSHPNIAAALSAPNDNASDGLNASMHARTMTHASPLTQIYESYTGKARMTGSGDAKRLVIHFQTMEAYDACVGAAHQQFPDLVFHAHDPKQLQSDEDL